VEVEVEEVEVKFGGEGEFEVWISTLAHQHKRFTWNVAHPPHASLAKCATLESSEV